MKFLLLPLSCCIALAVLGCGGATTVEEESEPPAAIQPAAPAVGDVPVSGGEKTAVPPTEEPAQLPAPDDAVSKLLENDATRRWLIKRAHADAPVREAAAAYLDGLGDDAPRLLLGALRDAQAEVRLGAAFALLGRAETWDDAAVEALRTAIDDLDARVRSVALQAVTQMDRESALVAVPQLVALLRRSDETPQNRARAARVLGMFGPEAQASLAALRKCVLGDPSREVRAACLRAMIRVDSLGVETTDTLAAVLEESKQPNLRRLAARQLARMGAQTQRVVPQLVAALADDDERVRRSAADALTAAGKKAVPELVKQLQAKDRQTRLLVITTLARLGAQANAAIQPLEECLNDSDEQVRRAAQMALNEINRGRL